MESLRAHDTNLIKNRVRVLLSYEKTSTNCKLNENRVENSSQHGRGLHNALCDAFALKCGFNRNNLTGTFGRVIIKSSEYYQVRINCPHDNKIYLRVPANDLLSDIIEKVESRWNVEKFTYCDDFSCDLKLGIIGDKNNLRESVKSNPPPERNLQRSRRMENFLKARKPVMLQYRMRMLEDKYDYLYLKTELLLMEMGTFYGLLDKAAKIMHEVGNSNKAMALSKEIAVKLKLFNERHKPAVEENLDESDDDVIEVNEEDPESENEKSPTRYSEKWLPNMKKRYSAQEIDMKLAVLKYANKKDEDTAQKCGQEADDNILRQQTEKARDQQAKELEQLRSEHQKFKDEKKKK